MALKEIRNYVAPRIGANDLVGNEALTARVNDLINLAASEVYEERDLPGILMECFVEVSPNQTIALPQFVGPLRAIREPVSTNIDGGPGWTRPWESQFLLPRYNNDNWEKRWTKWSYRGISPIQRNLENAGVLTLEIAAPEDIVISITGQTLNSNSIVDEVSITTTSNLGAISFVDVASINRRVVGVSDITIKDINGNIIAVLYNNKLETGYSIYDVSQFPYTGINGTVDKCLEILYKKPLTTLINDNDIFPIPGYDVIIGKKAVQIFEEDKPGAEERALLMDKRITRDINRKAGDVGTGVKQTMQFDEEPFFNTRRYLNYDER